VGQTSKGILAGVVRDSTGAVLPDASIVITNQETGETRTVTSSSTGSYRAEAINPGRYQIHVTNPGFAAVDVKDIAVLPSVVTTYDATLPVGQTATTVEVEANTNEINTQNGQLSGTILSQELRQVPIFSLNPADLTSEFPGVTRQYSTVQNLGGSGGNGLVKLTVNGARPRANNFMMDGQDINDVSLGGEAIQPIQPDFFSNVTVLLNDASAEFGRAGGAVINQITQAGTNHFHGSVHEIYTGSGLDAIDGQARQAKPVAPKARYDTHQYGFTAGGPIFKDKLFAFGGGTWYRYYGKTQAPVVELPDAAGFAAIKSLATAGNAQANLFLQYLNNGSYLNAAQYSSISGTPLESFAVSSMAGCPTGCTITAASFQRNAVPQQSPDTQWLYRIDFIPRSSDTFSFRYIHDRQSFVPYFPLNPTSLPGFDSQNTGVAELGGGVWTHVFTGNLLNEFRVSETRINAQFLGTPDTIANPLAQLYNVTFTGTHLASSPNGAVQAFGVSQNMPQGRIEELYQFQDTVGYTHGRQSFRAGVDIGRLLETDLIAQTHLGALTYSAGGGISQLDNFFKDQTGTTGSATKTFGPTRTDPHIWKVAWFVQDDVKLSPDFTFNLGVRYDYLTNPLNSLTYPAIDLNNVFAPINTYVPVNADKNNIAPRIGFAYVPRFGVFKDGKTVFRGGIGMFYDPFFTNILVNSAQSSPVAPTTTLSPTAANGPNGLPNSSGLIATMTPAFSPTSSVQSAISTLVNPLTYQYNFGMERSLPFQIKGAVNYVGSRGQKLYSNRQLNYQINGNFINPARRAINVRDNRADSQYHSLQVQVDRAFTRGLFFRMSYTYSKLLDDSSEVFTTFAAPTSYQANLAGNGIRQDWGPSAFDRRNQVVLTYLWTPAGFRSDNMAADAFLSAFTRHITISGQTQLYSGLYTSFNTSGSDINWDGSATNDRPVLSNPSAPMNLVGTDGSWLKGGITGVYYDQAVYNASPSTSRVLKPINAGDAHFLVPSQANGANMVAQEVGRNSFPNAGQQYWNVAVEKAVPTPFTHLEGSSLVFRVEAQQLGNHNNVTYFTNNVTQVGLPGYQNISSAREANNQHLRLWAKFQF
jgi:hypothetical protein